MADDNSDSESKLRKLGERVRESWGKLPGLSQQTLDEVRKAAQEQWQQEHAGTKATSQTRQKLDQTLGKTQNKQQSESPSKSESQKSDSKSHGHSH